MTKEEYNAIPTSKLVELLDARMQDYQKFVRPLAPEVRLVIRCVCNSFFVTESQLMGESRTEPVAHARFAAMAIIKSMCYSLIEVGDLFGRDHSTVIHAMKRTKELLEVDRVFRFKFESTLLEIKKTEPWQDFIPMAVMEGGDKTSMGCAATRRATRIDD